MRESFSLYPNSRMSSAARKRMLKPSLILRRISPRINEVISGVQADAWGTMEMAASNASGDHGAPCESGFPPLHTS